MQLAAISKAIVLVPATRLALRLAGLKWTAARLATWSSGAVRSCEPDDAQALAEAVTIVANQPLIGGRCLPRSLTQWALLRRRGVDAVLVIGAAPPQGHMLSAHAWVEVAGAPVDDAEDVRRNFGSFDLELPRLDSRTG